MAKSLRQLRHKARILAMQALFQYDARHDEKPDLAQLTSFNWMDYAVPEEERAYARLIIHAAFNHLAEIDEIIKDRLVNWEFERISPVSRAILRIAVTELRFMPEGAEPAVIIDEAILMAKQYDSAETTSFVNGLLDDVRRAITEPAATSTPKLSQKIKIKKKR